MALEKAIDKPNAPPMKTHRKTTHRNTPVDRFTIHLYFIRHLHKYSFFSLTIEPNEHLVV